MKRENRVAVSSGRTLSGRGISILMTLAMAFGLVLGVADVATAKTSDGKTVLAFTADMHNGADNAAANRLGTWVDNVNAIYNKIDLMGFCGDMGAQYTTGQRAQTTKENEFWAYTKEAMTAAEGKLGAANVLYTTGEAEIYNGKFATTENELKAAYKVDQQGMSGSNFLIYCMGTDNWNNSTSNYTQDQISKLSSYLSSADASKTIIVMSHYPLHTFAIDISSLTWEELLEYIPEQYRSFVSNLPRDQIEQWIANNSSSMGVRKTTNANLVIDALNEAADAGKTIVFLWGHNHSMYDTHYDEVFEPGETLSYDSAVEEKQIKFYYAAAGCMSDAEVTGSESVLGKGLVITIGNNKSLAFSYRDAAGNDVTNSDTEVIPVTKVTLNKSTLDLEVGQSSTLSATVEPSDATYPNIVWAATDTKVAMVDQNGRVTAMGAGSTEVYATAVAGGKYAVCTVTVTAPEVAVDSVTLSDTTSNLTVGDTKTLTATVSPSNATDKTVSWTSSNNNVATVDANGKVTAVAAGNATITATAGGKSATCRVTVQAATVPVDSVTLNKTSAGLKVGESTTLTATVSPSNATDKTVSWTSSNNNVATVDANGKVTAVAAGNATITATAGGKSATCRVTVTASVEPQPESVPVYRMYNTASSEHLYTTDASEYAKCGKGAYKDWNGEDIAWYAPAEGTEGAKPVYRLYNAGLGDHHYTADESESSDLVAHHGWVLESIIFYSGGDVPVYRLYNGGLKHGQHHYTADKSEVDQLVAKHGWTREGVGMYCLSVPEKD